jgi:hypothetical protein
LRERDAPPTEYARTSELYLYSGGDHNLSNDFGQAMTRSVQFFDRHLQVERSDR